MGIEDIDYEKQIELIGLFVFRRIKNKYNMMDPLIANFNNLILLRAIEKTDSYNYNKVSKDITDNYIGALIGFVSGYANINNVYATTAYDSENLNSNKNMYLFVHTL